MQQCSDPPNVSEFSEARSPKNIIGRIRILWIEMDRIERRFGFGVGLILGQDPDPEWHEN